MRFPTMFSETGLSHPVKYFTDRSKKVLLLWIIYVISVLFLLCFRAHLFIMPCGHLLGRADLLTLVCDV